MTFLLVSNLIKEKNAVESSANQVSEFFETFGNQASSSLPFTQEKCQKLMALITHLLLKSVMPIK
jgi:hypothetical protein